MGRKTIKWHINDVFAVPLLNGKYALGHILDQRIVNAVRIALYNELVTEGELENIDLTEYIQQENLLSLIEVTKWHLNDGAWKIVGNKLNVVSVESFPNEQFRSNNWINSVTYDAGLTEDFLNSFYALLPWDDWHDPDYLDKYLVDISKKPKNLIYKKDI
jgi:hypothetical protein